MAFVKKRGDKPVKWDACWDEYRNGKRKSRSKTFATQTAAKQFLTTIGVRGASSSDPFKALTDSFLDDFENTVKAKHREESTLLQLRQHINQHVMTDSEFSSLKCDEIGTPEVQRFLDRLYSRVSPVMTSKVRTTLSQVFSFGSRRGFVASNPARDSKVTLTSRPEAGADGEKFVLPPKDDLRKLLKAVQTYDNTGRAEAIVRVFMYAGLRASEFRGLPIRGLSVDAPQPKLRVDQKADRFDKIGRVKAKTSQRDIVLGGETVRALNRWLKVAPESVFVFPNDSGNVWSYPNLWHRFWVPLMNHAGLVTDEAASATVRDWSKERADFKQPRFGLHMLRHVYASLQIEQGVQPKRLQALMGHATLKLTMDTYGHLWPDEAGDKLAANVENVLG
jgi:integrase